MARFSVALLLLLSFISAAQAVLVYNFNQCGGTGGICKTTPGVKCANAPYPGYACGAKVSTCQKITAAYWQCRHDVPGLAHPAIKPTPFTVPAGELTPFTQCGGKGGSCKTKGVCADATWPKAICGASKGVKYSCFRQSALYWQCNSKAFKG